MASRWSSASPFTLFSDVIAGIVLAVLSIPLAITFALAAGLTPAQGISASVVAAITGCLFGGSKYQIFGPTPVLLPVILSLQNTTDLLFITTAVAGVCLVVMTTVCGRCSRNVLKRFVRWVPNSVHTGFVLGIVWLMALQVYHDVQELSILVAPEKGSKTPRGSRGFFVSDDLLLFIISVLLCATMHRTTVLSRIVLLSLGGYYFVHMVRSGTTFAPHMKTLETKYGKPPSDLFDWESSRAQWMSWLDAAKMETLLLSPSFWYGVLAMAVAAVFETLVCATLADAMANVQHWDGFDPNGETRAQGLVFLFVSFLLGMPSSGTLTRTVWNVQLGARTPFSGLVMASVTYLIIVFWSPIVYAIPIACLHGVLCYLAWLLLPVTGIWEAIYLSDLVAPPSVPLWTIRLERVLSLCVTAYLVGAHREVVGGVVIGCMTFWAVRSFLCMNNHQGDDDGEKYPIIKRRNESNDSSNNTNNNKNNDRSSSTQRQKESRTYGSTIVAVPKAEDKSDRTAPSVSKPEPELLV